MNITKKLIVLVKRIVFYNTSKELRHCLYYSINSKAEPYSISCSKDILKDILFESYGFKSTSPISANLQLRFAKMRNNELINIMTELDLLQ